MLTSPQLAHEVQGPYGREALGEANCKDGEAKADTKEAETAGGSMITFVGVLLFSYIVWKA